MTDTWGEYWPGLYSEAGTPISYPGNADSYRLAGEFLEGDQLVEEWGCATTFGRQFIPAPYRGVDGAPSQFVNEVADLRTYHSKVPNAIIRHVLEHNWEWRTILDNFLSSFTHRAVIILFIPLGEHDINRSFENRVDQPQTPPGLQLDERSFWGRLIQPEIRVVRDVELSNDTPPFGYERVIFLERQQEYNPLNDDPPICFGCKWNQGWWQLRVDLVLDGNRYEIAYNYCDTCLKQAKDGLYSLDVVPEVTWTQKSR